MFRVEKPVGKPVAWVLVSTHDDLSEAERAAEALCKSADIYTEPRDGLKRGYFSSARSDRWAARISVEGVHAHDNPRKEREGAR